MKKKMPNEVSQMDIKAEKKRLKEERGKLKQEQKNQKKEVRKKAKEISHQEAAIAEEDETSGVSVFAVTLAIVVIWIAILCLLVKLDVGGFGSNVLKPVLQNVPVLNLILPGSSEVAVSNDDGEAYGGYTSLREAVDYIKELELELERAQTNSTGNSEQISELQAEVDRLKTFEENQVEFQRIKTQFYEEVVYADNGPGIEEYQKYYESIDPTTAETLYKQVVQQTQETTQVKDYANAYAAMKPKEAAAIFEAMTDDLNLAARILGVMGADDRGKILGAMNADVAARITKLMDPES